jgi:hypothetical protein
LESFSPFEKIFFSGDQRKVRFARKVKAESPDFAKEGRKAKLSSSRTSTIDRKFDSHQTSLFGHRVSIVLRRSRIVYQKKSQSPAFMQAAGAIGN